MEIVRRFFVVATCLWALIVIFFVCIEIDRSGNEQYLACMGQNTFAQYDEALKSKCRYASEYAGVYSVIKFVVSRNEKSDEYRLVFWIPVALWWALFWAIRWIAGGAKVKRD